ncbi:hypothetical protein TI05_15240, partial [Achromatium sp. WMS3]
MITKDNEKSFIDIIDKTTSVTTENLSQVLETEADFDLKDAQQTVNEISSTIDFIAANFEDLQQAKQNGQSRSEWLKGKLDKTIETVENTTELIGEIKESLRKSNAEIGIDISEPLKNKAYELLNKTAIVNDFQNEIKNNTLLGAVIIDNGQIKIDDKHKEIKAIKDYFEAKLDSPQDQQFKKAIATATIIAQKKHLLPKKIVDKTPDAVAMIVDRGVSAAKVAYKVETGELSPLDAVEYTIDRNVVILDSVITKTTTRLGGVIGGAVGAAIGSVFGKVGVGAGAAIGTVVGKASGYSVGRFIGEGVKKVATAVKSVASKAWNTAKSVGSKILSLFS